MLFQPGKALVGAFSLIVKTDCETDGSFYITSLATLGRVGEENGERGICGDLRGLEPGSGYKPLHSSCCQTVLQLHPPGSRVSSDTEAGRAELPQKVLLSHILNP